MIFFVPQGIGDSIWAIHKAADISRHRGDGTVSIRLACGGMNQEIESRAVPFLRRFSFIDDVALLMAPVHPYGPAVDKDGFYRYIPDGPAGAPFGCDYALIPNAALEKGIRLEAWLPEFECDWGIMRHFRFLPEELEFASTLREQLGRYVIFYPGPLEGNTSCGHNRGMIWEPDHWARLGHELHERYGVQIVVVGASYDADYWTQFLSRRVNPSFWHEYIGKWHIAQTYAVVKGAECCVSYQSGIGIVASYLGVPTAIFWRAKGDSVRGDCLLHFEESFKDAWVDPAMLEAGKHLGCVYGRHDVDYIAGEIAGRGWIR